jgi:hypothetical protein
MAFLPNQTGSTHRANINEFEPFRAARANFLNKLQISGSLKCEHFSKRDFQACVSFCVHNPEQQGESP